MCSSDLKTPEITIKKRPEKSSKGTAESTKSVAESSGKNKEKDNQNIGKQSQPTSSTSTLVSTPDTTVPNLLHSEKTPNESATKATNKTKSSVSKTQSTFNLESELAKIKISVPLAELATQDVYKGQIFKALNLGENNVNRTGVLALQLVLLIQPFQTLYIVGKHQMTQLPRQQIKQSQVFPRHSPLSI